LYRVETDLDRGQNNKIFGKTTIQSGKTTVKTCQKPTYGGKNRRKVGITAHRFGNTKTHSCFTKFIAVLPSF
jgi:hypothetical protein